VKRALLGVAAVFTTIEKIILLASLAGMLVSVAIAIVARPLAIDVPWVTPMVLALMIVATFSGAALATATRRHITMDLLTKALGPRGRAIISALVSLLGGCVATWLTAAGMIWVKGNMEFEDPISLALKLPDWWLQAVVPTGFFLFAVHFFINALLDINGLISGDLSHLPDPNSAAAHGVH